MSVCVLIMLWSAEEAGVEMVPVVLCDTVMMHVVVSLISVRVCVCVDLALFPILC